MPLGRLSLLLLVVLGGAGCGPCETATCRADRAVERWPSDPDGVTAETLAIADEASRTVVIDRLENTYPGQTRRLCDGLPRGPSKQRCERISNRPHLNTAPPDTSGGHHAGMMTAPGRPGANAEPTSRPVHGFPDVTLPLPAAGPLPDKLCEDVPDVAACLDHAALEALIAGNPGGADAVCARHATSRWADECRFQAAEEATRAKHVGAYPFAALLCGRATEFAQECWSHVLTMLPPAIPAPADAGAATVGIEAAAAVRHVWSEAGPGVADRHVDRFWALYFANMYRNERDVIGTPLDAYPAEAWPHVRAAVTARLSTQGALHGSLEEQTAAVQAALATRPVSARNDRGTPSDLVYVTYLGEPAADAPSAFFLGGARRPVSTDEAEDVRLCVVEAAARREPPDTAVLDEAAVLPGVVGAEAARLEAVLAAMPVTKP